MKIIVIKAKTVRITKVMIIINNDESIRGVIFSLT